MAVAGKREKERKIHSSINRSLAKEVATRKSLKYAQLWVNTMLHNKNAKIVKT